MSDKPYFGDKQYNDYSKSYEERYGQYKRDLLLWEQTEALNKIQKQNEEYANEQRRKMKEAEIERNLNHSNGTEFYSGSYDRTSDDYGLFEINLDIWSTDTDREILGKKIDERIEIIFSKIKYRMKILEFWTKVKEAILILIALAITVGWIPIAIFIDNIYSSNFIKNSIIACIVATITLFILSSIRIINTKNEIFRLYDEKIKITQEIKDKKKH